MLRVALTGGIATGKSYVLARFAVLGVPTIDADVIAHDVVSSGRPAANEIRAHFGDAVFQANGEVDRPRLAARVFDVPADRVVLESIVHPCVRATIDQWFSALPSDSTSGFAVADVPLLYETGRETAFDQVVVTACAPELQLERLLARDGATASDTRKRMDAQLAIGEKVKRADYVVWTDQSFAETDAQVETVRAALAEVSNWLPG